VYPISLKPHKQAYHWDIQPLPDEPLSPEVLGQGLDRGQAIGQQGALALGVQPWHTALEHLEGQVWMLHQSLQDHSIVLEDGGQLHLVLHDLITARLAKHTNIQTKGATYSFKVTQWHAEA